MARWAVDPWGTGVAQLTRMVFEEQPLALLGSVDSASTHLAEQVVAKANLPLVSPVATDGTVTLAGVAWMFACAPSDQAVADALVSAAVEQLGVTPGGMAMLTGTDHASRMTAAAVRQEFSRRGRLPDFQFQVTAGATDLARHVAALIEARPKTILIIAGAEDAGRWVTQVRAALPEVVLFGGPELGRRRFRELVGALADEVRVPELVQRDPANPAWIRFCARFQAERGYPPDYAAVLTYDATRLLLEAVRRAGPNRTRIREMLLSLSPWPGLGGEIRFDGTGQNVRAGLRMTPPFVVRASARPQPPHRLKPGLPTAGSWPWDVRRARELVLESPPSTASNP